MSDILCISRPTVDKWIDAEIIKAEIPETTNDKFSSIQYYPQIFTIPLGVEKIAKSAFKYCKKLQLVQFPDFLITIGNNAFFGCENLQLIHLPNSFPYYFSLENSQESQIYTKASDLWLSYWNTQSHHKHATLSAHPHQHND